MNNTLQHHGILGQKWGVRRFQNSDGSLTEAGKKRYSQEYESTYNKAVDDVNSRSTQIYVNAYNKAADKMNNGLTDKYNDDYDKKLGNKAKDHDYENDEEYSRGYEDLFNSVFEKEFNKEMYKEISSNKYFKEAEELCNKYSLDKYSEFALENKKQIENMRKLIESYKD